MNCEATTYHCVSNTPPNAWIMVDDSTLSSCKTVEAITLDRWSCTDSTSTVQVTDAGTNLALSAILFVVCAFLGFAFTYHENRMQRV